MKQQTYFKIRLTVLVTGSSNREIALLMRVCCCLIQIISFIIFIVPLLLFGLGASLSVKVFFLYYFANQYANQLNNKHYALIDSNTAKSYFLCVQFNNHSLIKISETQFCNPIFIKQLTDWLPSDLLANNKLCPFEQCDFTLRSI